jgi:hypothetical protein
MNKYIIKYSLILLFLFVLVGGCEKNVSHSPVAPLPSEGKIIVNSIPQGFVIYQNGRNTGKITPDSLIFLDPGIYEITLKRLYWKDTAVVVDLGKDTVTEVNINYLPNSCMYGKLAFYSNPLGVKILINDSLTNNITPDTLKNFLPGTYDVTFRLENHRDAKFEAIAESGKLKSYSANLKDTSVWLDFKMSNSGIQSNQLSSIAIDNKGIRWIGSLDNGLIRFDDHNFTNYNTSNSPIPDNFIRCLSVDVQDNVWVGTTYGIGVFDGFGWRVYNRYNSGLASQIVNTIRFDSDGNVWIGTSTNLTKFDGVNWIIYNYVMGHDYINDIYIDSKNKLWLATSTNGIITFQDGNFFPFSQPKHNYPSLNVSSLDAENSSAMWFCFNPDSVSFGGVGYWKDNLFTTVYSGLPTDIINDIFIDSESNKWISTSIGFIWYNEQNVPQIFTTFNSLITTDNTYASVRDEDGVVWIATYKGGLNKFKVNNLK